MRPSAVLKSAIAVLTTVISNALLLDRSNDLLNVGESAAELERRSIRGAQDPETDDVAFLFERLDTCSFAVKGRGRWFLRYLSGIFLDFNLGTAS